MNIQKYMYLTALSISCITSFALAGEKFDDNATAQLHELTKIKVLLENTSRMKPEIKKLIDAKADINAINEYGRTPVQEAIFRANPYIALYLVELGADISKMGTGTYGMNCQEFAVIVKDTLDYESYKEVYNDLITKLAEINSQQ